MQNRVFRPPAEADSLIVQIARGCPHNNCCFCGMYKGVPYQERAVSAVIAEVEAAVRRDPGIERVFLADGDGMYLQFAILHDLLTRLNAVVPRLKRVGIYANGSSICSKSSMELVALRQLKLHTLYMGLESGDAAVLARAGKTDSVAAMIEGCRRAQDCGLRLSVMVLIGLGGRSHSTEHALATARAVNAMQPRLLSFLRLSVVANTPLASSVDRGEFRLLSEYGVIAEMRQLLAQLELSRCVFRANHASNLVALEGRLPHDRSLLVSQLDTLLASGRLDRDAPPLMPPWL